MRKNTGCRPYAPNTAEEESDASPLKNSPKFRSAHSESCSNSMPEMNFAGINFPNGVRIFGILSRKSRLRTMHISVALSAYCLRSALSTRKWRGAIQGWRVVRYTIEKKMQPRSVLQKEETFQLERRMNLEDNLTHEIEELKRRAKEAPNIDYSRILEAIDFGKNAHAKQLRRNGNPFFIHPVRVAIRALEYKLETDSIIASLLHDVVEDTDFSTQDIKQSFGEAVSKMVEALTKVKDSRKSTRDNRKLSLNKVFALGNDDFRVILIKLMDRLDNLSDLQYLERKKQREICLETSAVFIEITHELGLIEIERGLRDLVFRQLYPKRYRRISKQLVSFYNERYLAIQAIEDAVKGAISKELLDSCELEHVDPGYFLYNRGEVEKIVKSIIVKTKEPLDCYRVLGELHTKFRSVPHAIRDYISNRLANGWRGLETKVFVRGEAVTLKIVTSEFQEKNRFGIATLINEKIYTSDDYRGYIKLWFDLSVSSEPFRIEDVLRVRTTLPIQVLTPQGRMVELRQGATITDFAFSVHSTLGLWCAGGIIDNIRYPREKILEDGMIVEVIKSKLIETKRSWLEHVVMPGSKKEIRSYLKSLKEKKKRERDKQKKRNAKSEKGDSALRQQSEKGGKREKKRDRKVKMESEAKPKK